MALDQDMRGSRASISRRGFLLAGGAVVAGSAIAIAPRRLHGEPEEEVKESEKIKSFRTLGRTGFKVSDVGHGTARLGEASVIRYAYDHGVNYFDTAEGYSNGESEKKIGEMMQHMDRKTIFITTKLELSEEDTKQTVLDRFAKCLERMRAEYVDALYMHSVMEAKTLNHEGFHAATDRLKADGKLRFIGVSCHGPSDDTQDSMEKVLVTAAEDGRFDMMLLVYNFMNTEEAGRILTACKKKNVGTTAMKTVPGTLNVEPWDEENPSEDYTNYIDRMEERGQSRDESIRQIVAWVAEQMEAQEEMAPFVEKYKIQTQEQLREKAIQWALQSPDMNTVCVLMPDFESIDRIVSLSGKKLSSNEELFLREYNLAYNHLYCRHGCGACLSSCPQQLPVGRIMRYSYYFATQGREKAAMRKYARLQGRDASHCLSCNAPCSGSCPYGVDIQGQLFRAHSLLTLA